MHWSKFNSWGALLVVLCGRQTLAHADPVDSVPAGTSDIQTADPVNQARQAFVKANEPAKEMRWAEALAGFQRSMVSRPHAATAYNIGLCYRALGQYTRAYGAG